MIAKLKIKRTMSTALQKMPKHKFPQEMGAAINNEWTTTEQST